MDNEDVDSDQLLIAEALKQRLEEISKNLTEVESFPEHKHIYNDDPIHFQCICVFFIEPVSDMQRTMKSQTFRITRATRVIDLIVTSLQLWDQLDYLNDYRLYLIENETLKVLDETAVINNIFKTMKIQMKTAKFLLAPRNFKGNLGEMNLEEDTHNNPLTVKQGINKNEKYYNFVRRFAGVAKYVENQFSILKEKEIEEMEQRIVSPKKKKIPLLTLVLYGIKGVFFCLLFIFSLLSIIELKNPFKSYLIYNYLNYTIGHDYSEDVGTDIIDRVEQFLYQPNSADTSLKVVSLARLSIYQSNPKKCDKNYQKSISSTETCYKAYYESKDSFEGYKTAENILNKRYTIDNNEDLEPFVYSPSSPNNNYIQTQGNWEEFLENEIFKGFYTNNYEIDEINIEGDYGTYKGDNCVDIFIPISLINNDALNLILQVVGKDFFGNNFVKQKAVIFDFTVYNTITKTYYYIYFLYENSFTSDGPLPKVKIIPFYPDLKELSHGQAIYVLDIFRLIFVLVLFIIMFKTIYDEIIENITLQKKNKPSKSVLSIIFSLDVLIDLALFVIYVSLFALKVNNLYNKAKDREKASIPTESYSRISAMEYYNIATKYETVVMLECSLIICLLLKFFAYLAKLVRFHNIAKYIKLSITKGLSLFIFYIILIIFFAIFGQILFGPSSNKFTKYSIALLSTLELSISHFDTKIFTPSSYQEKYQVVFMFLLFVCVIYFFISSFFGVYLESYRLNSLKHGNTYEMRIIERLNKMEKEDTQPVASESNEEKKRLSSNN